MPRVKVDRSLLEAALVGFGHKLGEVTLKIAEIKKMLGKGYGAGKRAHTKRKPLSAAARARMASAQRKRWTAQKKQKGKAAATAKQSPRKKRRMSAAARKRIADATRKRWADYRVKKAGAIS